MKFLETIESDGTYFWLTDICGSRYRVAKIKRWRKLQIAQETSNYFAIIGKHCLSMGFIYDRLLFKGKCIVAYYSDEFEPYVYYHIYDEYGTILCRGKINSLLHNRRIDKKVKHHQKYSKNRMYHK